MTNFSTFLDEKRHWIAVCDRCAHELRTPRPHEELSMAAITHWVDQMMLHSDSHPDDTRVTNEDPLDDIGDDEDVEPLPGALSELED